MVWLVGAYVGRQDFIVSDPDGSINRLSDKLGVDDLLQNVEGQRNADPLPEVFTVSNGTEGEEPVAEEMDPVERLEKRLLLLPIKMIGYLLGQKLF